MSLVNWHILSGSVDLTCGRLDEFQDAIDARSLAQVQRTVNIGVHIRGRRNVGIRDGNQSGQIKHHVDILGQCHTKMRVPDVT